MNAAAAPPASDASTTGRAVAALKLLGPSTVLTALLSYYGYESLRSYYSYFGVDLGLLDLSPADYLVRTPDALFKPVSTLVLGVVVVTAAHLLLQRTLDRAAPVQVRRLAVLLGAAAAVVLLLGAGGIFAWQTGLAGPLCLVVAASLAEYAVWLLGRRGAASPATTELLRDSQDVRRGLVIAIVAVGAFWAVYDIAHARGTDLARETEASLPIQPQVVVYSTQDLHLAGPHVRTRQLRASKDSAYRFYTQGLRPLARTGDRWLLLPVGWSRSVEGAPVIVLDDAATFRVDMSPSLTGLP